MFRNSQLLRRSNQVKGNEVETDQRPTAILADPYEAEAGILVPVLAKFGFKVLESRDGIEAFEMARRQKTDLVVASVDLPNLSGTQLCERVREHTGTETPFILISPKDVHPDKLAGHETFASDYTQRPLNLEEFEMRLSGVLRAQSAATTSKRAVVESARRAERPAPIPPPPPTEQTIAEVKDPSFAVPAIETESIDALMTAAYLAEHDVRKETASLYKEAFIFLSKAIQSAENSERISLEVSLDLGRRLVRSLSSEKGLMMLATDRTSPFSFRQHSINTAIMSARIARTLRLTEERQIRVCIAGMLHDIGSIKLPRKLFVKHAGLSADERAEMQRRPLFSAELLSGYAGFEWLPEIVVQVYERENGSGYPSGLTGRDICEEAKILGVADVFEACMHRRPQREAMTGYRALEVITSAYESFGERTTKAMIRSFSVYPHNETVVLSTGEVGKVIDINPENPLRPIVRIMYSVERTELDPPRVVDLSKNSQLWITSSITPDQIRAGRK